MEGNQTFWGRDCVDSSDSDIGCKRSDYHGNEVEECICKENECNKYFSDSSASDRLHFYSVNQLFYIMFLFYLSIHILWVRIINYPKCAFNENVKISHHF